MPRRPLGGKRGPACESCIHGGNRNASGGQDGLPGARTHDRVAVERAPARGGQALE
jgi:hypothetical protein